MVKPRKNNKKQGMSTWWRFCAPKVCTEGFCFFGEYSVPHFTAQVLWSARFELVRLGGTVPEYISKCACKPHDKFMSLSICFHDANVSEQMFIACASCVDVLALTKLLLPWHQSLFRRPCHILSLQGHRQAGLVASVEHARIRGLYIYTYI